MSFLSKQLWKPSAEVRFVLTEVRFVLTARQEHQHTTLDTLHLDEMCSL